MPHRSRTSVAQLTEDQMAADAIITYVSPTRNSRFDLRAHRRLLRSRLRRATPTVGVADPNRADANGNCWDNNGNQQTCNKGVQPAGDGGGGGKQDDGGGGGGGSGGGGDKDDGMAAWEAAEEEARKAQKAAEEAVRNDPNHGGGAGVPKVPPEDCEVHGLCDPPADAADDSDWAESAEWREAEEAVAKAQKAEDDRAAQEAKAEIKRQRDLEKADKAAAEKKRKEVIRCQQHPKKCEEEEKKRKKRAEIDETKRTDIHRCGFSWDDAAVKAGSFCSEEHPECIAPPNTTDNRDSYWYGKHYFCYNDLPELGVRAGGKQCRHVSADATDAWCTEYCSNMGTKCDASYCECGDGGTGLENSDPFKVPATFNLSAPIQAPIQQVNVRKLPERNESLIAAAIAQGEAQLSVLPDCTWRPELGCSNVSQVRVTLPLPLTLTLTLPLT